MSNFAYKLSFIAIGLCIVSPVWAMPVSVTHVDIPNCCDFLSVPTNVDEVGINIFPPNETITATDQLATKLACISEANPSTFATEVSITNQTGRSYTNLWYVADTETTFTNVDGLVNNEHAFKIDAVGINLPLLSESTNANGIFEPGETWDFLIDGYFNTFGLPASAFMSIGVGTFSAGDQKSSGSIIGTPVPEPTSCLLLACGVATVLFRRR